MKRAMSKDFHIYGEEYKATSIGQKYEIKIIVRNSFALHKNNSFWSSLRIFVRDFLCGR